jgi:hypothetical protein
VFAALPGGATTVRLIQTPAHYRKPGFAAGGWDGPSVVLIFRSAAPPADVYRFYRQRAAAAGWQSTARGALGLTDRWAKTYPDGASATLDLALLGRVQTAASHVYHLSGPVAPIVRRVGAGASGKEKGAFVLAARG